MDAVGSALVHHMPEVDTPAARAAVAYTMSGLRMGLGQPGAFVGSVAPMEISDPFKPDLENDAQTRAMFQWR